MSSLRVITSLRTACRPVYSPAVCGAGCLEGQSTAKGSSRDALAAAGQLAAQGPGDGGAGEPAAGFVFPWLGRWTVRRWSTPVCHEWPVLQARTIQLLPKYKLQLCWTCWMAVIGFLLLRILCPAAQLCPAFTVVTCACGVACYDPKVYGCKNGGLTQNPQDQGGTCAGGSGGKRCCCCRSVDHT